MQKIFLQNKRIVINKIFFKITIKFIFISFLFLSTFLISFADEMGYVNKVTDGDTVHITNINGDSIKIRLLYIDSPEYDQPYGIESKTILEKLVLNKYVYIQTNRYDKYKRALGTIFYQKKDINLEMIKFGAAWHYKKYALSNQNMKDFIMYSENEKLAKQRKIGLWEMDAAPPWLWRKNKK